jgi:hypothetical protein
MKLTQLVAQYTAIFQTLQASHLENDPLGFEADHILQSIAKLPPQDSNDVAALAALAKHIIQVEDDPKGAMPLLRSIVHWAERGGEAIPSNVVPFLKLTSSSHH